MMKLTPDNKKIVFDIVEEALLDTNFPDAKPSEYYEELSTILDIFEGIKDDPEISNEDQEKIAKLELRIAEKMKLKAFW